MDNSVSVVIPCYNAAPYLAAAITSAIEQTVAPLEIIVVDDGSTDESAAIAESFGPPVQVFRQANRGESAARNQAIDLAQGQWIALLDADDVWNLNKLERLFAALRRSSSDVVCVYSDFYFFGESARQEEVQRPEYHARRNWRVDMLVDWSIPTITAMFRSELGRSVRFIEDVQHGEDMLFFLQLRERGPFVHVAEPLAGYRISATQQTRTRDHLLKNVFSRFAWFQKNLHLYDCQEQLAVRRGLAKGLAWGYGQAFRVGDRELLARYRDAYRKIAPRGTYVPLAFHLPLSVRPLCFLKDRIYSAMHRATQMWRRGLASLKANTSNGRPLQTSREPRC